MKVSTRVMRLLLIVYRLNNSTNFIIRVICTLNTKNSAVRFTRARKGESAFFITFDVVLIGEESWKKEEAIIRNIMKLPYCALHFENAPWNVIVCYFVYMQS